MVSKSKPIIAQDSCSGKRTLRYLQKLDRSIIVVHYVKIYFALPKQINSTDFFEEAINYISLTRQETLKADGKLST